MQASPIRRDTRRRFLATLAASGALTITCRPARAEDAWPSRPIHLILPYTVGGSADALARAIADQLRDKLGQTTIVDSRPGANSMMGAEIVARSAADGYTLLYLGWPTISTNLVVYRKVPYKLEDFQPITTIFRSPVALTLRRDSPIASLAELMAQAKQKGSIAYGTAGTGSSPHLLLERLKQSTGVNFEHVPYKGEGPAVLDVMGGHLPMFAGSLATPLQQIRSGALKAIVVSSAERLPAFPDVPTFREAGFAQHVFTYWHGFAAPAGVPRAIVDRLHAAIAAAIESEPVRNVFTPDQVPTILTPEAFTALIRQDIATWSPIIRASKLIE
jgi:tripartite-type tricarboxylate transporter receptor subunit TctC